MINLNQLKLRFIEYLSEQKFLKLTHSLNLKQKIYGRKPLIKWTESKLTLARRLEIQGLFIEEKYINILHNYGKDVEQISKMYTRHKNDPIIPRNAPPMAGQFQL